MARYGKTKNREWTDESLGSAIQALKNQGDDQGLDLFLENRLADTNIFCVSNRARLWNELGLSKTRQKAPDQAAICFENALALDPDYPAGLYNLATLNLKKQSIKSEME